MTDTTSLALVGYLRVSTAGQAADGFGLPVQKKEIAKWAKANGHTVVAWCQDAGVSGMVEALDRPGFRCVIEHLRNHEAVGVAMFDLSRIARALVVQEAALGVLWNMNAKVFTATIGEIPADDPDDPTRTLIRQVLGAVAQFQRAEQGRKMRLGREHKRKNGGRYVGTAPYGWKWEHGELVLNDVEQVVLADIRAARGRRETWDAIAARLNETGVLTKSGRQWSKQNLQMIFAEAERRAKASDIGYITRRGVALRRTRATASR